MPQSQTKISEADSKDRLFESLATLSEQMIAEHGKDFAMGALVLAARFIAESKPFKLENGRSASAQP